MLKQYAFKRCPRCGKDKTPEEFGRVGKYLAAYCRPCRRQYQREHNSLAAVQERRSCSKCGREGLIGLDFYTSNPECCKKCYNAAAKEIRARKLLGLKKTRRAAGHLADPRYYMLRGAKQRAVQHGWAFDIVLEDIVIPAVCPVLGIPLEPSVGRARDCSPSIDRIESAYGYVRGNIRVISYRANLLKNNATIEELVLVLADLRRLAFIPDVLTVTRRIA